MLTIYTNYKHYNPDKKLSICWGCEEILPMSTLKYCSTKNILLDIFPAPRKRGTIGTIRWHCSWRQWRALDLKKKSKKMCQTLQNKEVVLWKMQYYFPSRMLQRFLHEVTFIILLIYVHLKVSFRCSQMFFSNELSYDT